MNFNISKPHPPYKSVIHPIITVSILMAFAIFQIVIKIAPNNSSILGAISSLNPADIISLTNLQRQQAGLDPLIPNEKLAQAAQTKAQDMFLNDYWDHYSPTDNPPWTFILNAGYDYHYAGENLAKDYNDAPKLVQAWMDSPAHRENILNQDYQDIGIAVVTGTLNDKETVLIVQMFGTQFTPQDYAEAIKRQEKSSSGIEYSSLTNQNPIESFFTNKFLATKVFTLTTIIMLFFYVGFRIGHTKGHNDHPELKQQHWGHLLLIITLGILAWMTHDGDIL